MREISRLLNQAEKSASAAERANLIRQLWSIYAKLELDLSEIDRDIRAGVNRRVEAIACRSILAALATELALMGEDRPVPT